MNGSVERPRVVLFIVTSFWAYGELTIAIEFARRLDGSGFRSLFLIPPTHRGLVAAAGLEYHVMVPGAGKINRLQLADIQHVHRPVLVVLADFMNFDFCDRHYGLHRTDLAVFECPVGTFDDFTWGRPGAWLDTYGFKARYEAQITLEGLDFRLRPCPLNPPVVTGEPDVHPYPMLEKIVELGGADLGAEVRRELGVANGRPIILVTGATWQHMHAAYPRVQAFVAACRAMLERVLGRLLQSADVLAVGPSLVFHDGAPAGFHHVGQVDSARFLRLARAVDLHISTNIVSVSLHRLALGGIPSVALFSSLVKEGGQLRWAGTHTPALTDFAADLINGVDYLYPCRMFPVGWYHFLQSLLAGNPFCDVVSHVEIFDEEAAADTITPMLAGGPQRERVEAARQAYLDMLRQLPDVPTVVERISATAGVAA